MREDKKPVFGTVFDVVFYAMIASGVALVVQHSIEGNFALWQNVLFIAVAFGCLLQFFFKRRKRKARD